VSFNLLLTRCLTSFIASSIHIPSYASSPRVQPASRPASENIGLRATSALIQSVSDDILSRHLQQEEHRQQQQHSREPSMHEPFAHDPRSTSPLTQQPQTGYVQRILQSLRPVEQESGLFDVRRRQSLRRASGGGQPQERSTHNGSQAGSAGRDRAASGGESAAPGSGSGGAASGRGSAPRSEGEVGSLRGSGDSFEGAGIPWNEEVSISLFGISRFIDVGFIASTCWYLVVSSCPYWRRKLSMDQVQGVPLQDET
jgi:hypothetical protein